VTAAAPSAAPRSSVIVLAGLSMLVLAACSGARPGPTDLLRERFETEEAAAARERAPDLFVAASQARSRAAEHQRAGRVRAAEDESTRARLLLDAAIAESHRIALEEERLGVESEEREHELAYARDTERQEEVLAEVERREAARVAAEQAAMMFEQAVVDEEHRYRSRPEEREALHREAADVLGRRARLLLSAALALDAEDRAVEEVTDVLERADRESNVTRKLELAERAVRGALVALGSARARRPGPTSDEKAALVEAAREAGLEAEQRDIGMVLRGSDLFSATAATPGPAGARRIERLAAIIQAHPHGVVRVLAFAAGGTEAARRRLAEARASRIANLLVRAGVPDTRIESDAVIDAAQPDATNGFEAVFVAYGPDIPSPPPAPTPAPTPAPAPAPASAED
jgi:flagellar motor protein MotB